jgi:hypothetical protein
MQELVIRLGLFFRYRWIVCITQSKSISSVQWPIRALISGMFCSRTSTSVIPRTVHGTRRITKSSGFITTRNLIWLDGACLCCFEKLLKELLWKSSEGFLLYIRVEILIRGLEIHVCVIQQFCVKSRTINELNYNGNYYLEAKKRNQIRADLINCGDCACAVRFLIRMLTRSLFLDDVKYPSKNESKCKPELLHP